MFTRCCAAGSARGFGRIRPAGSPNFITGCCAVGSAPALGVPWRYPGQGKGETPQSLATPAFAGLSLVAESGIKSALTTGMTTDRKIFDFPLRRGIMTEIEYPGIAKLVSRLVWDQETVRSSRTTRTKIPLKLLISEGFFLFFVYCGADIELVILNISFQRVRT